jgi:hypothetical protein
VRLLAATTLLFLAALGCSSIDPVDESTTLAEATVGAAPLKLVCHVSTTYMRGPTLPNGCGWSVELTIGGDPTLFLVDGPSARECDEMREACEGASGSVAGLDLPEHRAVAVWTSLAASPVAVYDPKVGPTFVAPVLTPGPTDATALVAAMPPLDAGITSHLREVTKNADDPVWQLLTPERLPGHLDEVLQRVGYGGVPDAVVLGAITADPGRVSPAVFEAGQKGQYRALILEHPLPDEAAMTLAALSTDPPHEEGYLPDRRGDPWLAQLAVARKLSAAAPLIEARLPPLRFGMTINDEEMARWVETVGWLDQLDPKAGARLALDALRQVPGVATTTCMPLTSVTYDGSPGTFAWAIATILAQHDVRERRDAVLAIGKDPAASEAARHAALYLLRTWKDKRADQITGVSLNDCQAANVR